MNILMPINSRYLRDRYKIEASFWELLIKEVLPNVLEKFSSDERVKTIELITDADIGSVSEPNSKTIFTNCDIGNLHSANEVVQELLNVRTVKSEIIVQTNLLYPFISVNSLQQAIIA